MEKRPSKSGHIDMNWSGLVDYREVKKGVILLHTLWSGQSKASLTALRESLQQDGFDNIELFVAHSNDVMTVSASEELKDAMVHLYGELPMGNGEAYWIRNGRIIHRDHGYYDADGFKLLRDRLQEFTN